ncbi:hypothetical protein BIW11_01581 [Tropilaelaps mercedesae]|uniref:Uncharacterized protein n=1 Tax=Tropilaelaps mercedesae TaxID=418985 RepID=A0A1V9XBW4_9ACAR|nr:hypothetical protein BIW11_01581 [Tropilaelaps mercedesae]
MFLSRLRLPEAQLQSRLYGQHEGLPRGCPTPQSRERDAWLTAADRYFYLPSLTTANLLYQFVQPRSLTPAVEEFKYFLCFSRATFSTQFLPAIVPVNFFPAPLEVYNAHSGSSTMQPGGEHVYDGGFPLPAMAICSSQLPGHVYLQNPSVSTQIVCNWPQAAVRQLVVGVSPLRNHVGQPHSSGNRVHRNEEFPLPNNEDAGRNNQSTRSLQFRLSQNTTQMISCSPSNEGRGKYGKPKTRSQQKKLRHLAYRTRSKQALIEGAKGGDKNKTRQNDVPPVLDLEQTCGRGNANLKEQQQTLRKSDTSTDTAMKQQQGPRREKLTPTSAKQRIGPQMQPFHFNIQQDDQYYASPKDRFHKKPGDVRNKNLQGGTVKQNDS